MSGDGDDRDPEPQPATISGDFGAELIERLAGRETGFGRYVLKGEFARGGQGAILRVWDEDLRRNLAMKVTLAKGKSADASNVDAQTLGRFIEEAQVTGQLDHPGIVPIHELGLDDGGGVYFTMRLVKGTDLARVFEMAATGEEGWNETRVLGVLLKVCEALSYAHSKRVIHRDLKPANIMVGRFGEVYVMDWGLARVLDSADRKDIRVRPASSLTMSRVKSDRRAQAESTADSPLMTMDGDVLGTPAYMSPEQARGDLEAMGPASDVYSMGAILYQLLAGHMPYVPPTARLNAYAVWGLVQNGPPHPVSQLAQDAPAELVAICEKAMAREPADRFPDMRELAEDVRAFIEKRVVSAYETGAVAEFRKWVQRNRPLAASIAAALALAIGGLSWVSLVQSQARRTVAAKNLALLSANATIQAQNSDLLAATQAAQEQEQRATQLATDVLSLSAQRDVDDLVARVDELWPADPGRLPEYEAWLSAAQELIDGRPADPGQGIKRRASLAEHRDRLAELRAGATPLTAEQVTAHRASHPLFEEWQAKQAELTWRSRMLGLLPWPSEAEVEAELAQEDLPDDTMGLTAKMMEVAPPGVYGSEVKGLLLYRRAMAAAPSDEYRNQMQMGLAFFLLRVGRPDEALEELEAGLESMERLAAAMGNSEMVASNIEYFEQQVAEWQGDELPERHAERDKLAAEVDALDRLLNERHSFEYEDSEARWWDAQLSKLVADLEALRDPETGPMSARVSGSFGWGVARRRDFAKTIAERSVEGAEAKRLWSEAAESIRSLPQYGGLLLAPQLGLLPIGTDPDSGLWEFAHLQTGEPAVRGADGRLALTEETGLVFVLLPGGDFWFGAQKSDPNGRNYDPEALDDEMGVLDIGVPEFSVPAFFLSKYEMTQGQWERFTGTQPSSYQEATYGDGWKAFNKDGSGYSTLQPVENVSWVSCMAVLRRLECDLPTEPQWEYAARGGSSGVYGSVDELTSLADVANLADAFGKSRMFGWQEWEQDLDDGYGMHAPVGSFSANAYGLHDMIGNLSEWCRNDYGDPTGLISRQQLDELKGSDLGARAYRGGSYFDVAKNARVARRRMGDPETRKNTVGLRPARAVMP